MGGNPSRPWWDFQPMLNSYLCKVLRKNAISALCVWLESESIFNCTTFVCFGTSVRMGNSLEQHRQVIGGFYSKACRVKKSRANMWEPWEGEVDSWQVNLCNTNQSQSINWYWFPGFQNEFWKIYLWQVSTARFIITVMMLGAMEVASFSVINRMLLTLSGIETNPDPSTFTTNGETLKWLENLQNGEKLSEERLKNQAEIFFNREIKENKKVIKKQLLGLVQKQNNLLLQSQRKLQKKLGGLGKHGEKAPADFGLAISEEKKRNSFHCIIVDKRVCSVIFYTLSQVFSVGLRLSSFFSPRSSILRPQSSVLSP